MTLSPGRNPLAKAFGEKVKAIRKLRGVTQTAAAEQLGIHEGQLIKIERGEFLPARWVQWRIHQWATKGHTFSATDKRKYKFKTVVGAQGFIALRVRLPEYLRERLRNACARLNMSQEEFLVLAAERLLDEPAELGSYEEAMKRLNRAIMTQALAECPELKLFLEADLDFCKGAGAELTVYKPPKLLSPAEDLVETEFEDLSEWDTSEWELEEL